MIKPKQSIERFQQSLKIQDKISKLHGYKLQNSLYSPKSNSLQKKQGSFIINTSINPLNVRQKQIQKSQRLKQLIKQIQQVQMQKQIDRMIQQNSDRQINMIELLNAKIREYNYLVQHKHLINRKPRSMFSSDRYQDKEDGYYIQKLRQKQRQLNRTSSMMTRINKNKEIANIYKDYSQSFKLNKPNYKLFAFQNMTKSKKQEDNLKNTIKIKELLQNINSSNKTSRYEENIDVQYPYVNKKYQENLAQFKKNQRRIKNLNSVFKQKLKKIQFLNTSEVSHTNNQIQTNSVSQQLTLQSDLTQIYDRIGKSISNKDQQDKMKESQMYCLAGLRKRSPKFVKASGSKFVDRYNAQKIAKEMIQAPSPENKKQIKLNISKMYKRRLKIPQSLPKEDKEVLGYMIQEEDDAYYWTTCRNQKINLLLKGKIHK